ncbi:MAG: hypothetical protein GY799_21405 [Desulfobulbaceae bacterium]|nr:hypothetical protein [Desulfobulbaceae bacterium]
MALSTVEQVRMSIGDITLPYILTDDQIQHYLDTNNASVSDTSEELIPIVHSALAARGSATRVEELWEDNTKQASNYNEALKRASILAAAKASPIIGGSATAVTVKINQFDPDWLDYEDTDIWR